jgi:hypothetical protein
MAHLIEQKVRDFADLLSSAPITAVPFNLDASHSSWDGAWTICAELDVAGAGPGVGGACASAVDIINPLTAAKITSVLLMTNLLSSPPLSGNQRMRDVGVATLIKSLSYWNQKRP